MEVTRKKDILLSTKIPVAEIQHFPDSRHKGNSGLCLSPDSVTTVLAGKYLMSKRVSVQETHLAFWAAVK